MVFKGTIIDILCLVPAICVDAVPTSTQPPYISPVPTVRQIYQFPEPTWLENLAPRANGSILTTVLTAPQLYQINPFDPSAEPWLVHEFPGYLGLLGIVETKPDVFAVIAGNLSLTKLASYAGSYAVWEVDFNPRAPHNHESEHSWYDWEEPLVKVRKIADVEEAEFLNGMAYLATENAVLLADSWKGVVWKLDLSSGDYEVAISDPLMTKCNPSVLEGINGLKLYGDSLYFTRGFCSVFVEVPITPEGLAIGPAEIIGTAPNSTWTWDDFVIDEETGDAYVAAGYNNLISKIGSDGQLSIVAGNLNSTQFAEPTALRFGRMPSDLERKTVYVTTAGAIGDPIDGRIRVGGQLIAIDLA